MMEIEGDAAPQMDIAMKPKANVISFEDIVTSTIYPILVDKSAITTVN